MLDRVSISVRAAIMLEDFDPSSIQDENARQAIFRLFNLIEDLAAENRKLREENQRLRDENNRLKGEQGKPNIKPSKGTGGKQADYSSERERYKPRSWKKASKTACIVVNREEVIPIDPEQLPPDAEFKGYQDVVVQDIKIETDNVQFRKEKYHSPSERKTYVAQLPAGYGGQFGPGIKAMTLVLYYAINTSEAKIKEFFEHMGVVISAGQISNLLVKGRDDFHAEKEAVVIAGLRSSPWQHIDDTGARVNGVNEHTHVIGNPLYTAYITHACKDRLAVVEALCNGHDVMFRLDSMTYDWLAQVNLPPMVVDQVRQWPQEQNLDRQTMEELLANRLPDLGKQSRQNLLSAAAVSAYHAQPGFPVPRLLVCDDADQFKRVTEEVALCWVHEGRHYKKLDPQVAHNRQKLDDFMKRFWEYYDELLTYQRQPSPQEAERLSKVFDVLFSEKTDYYWLDKRIAKTQAKKERLLTVLKHPEIPLHNNPAEIEVRRRARKRDVSFGPRTQDGKRAWDTFMSLAATAKKLDVSFYQYIHDRVTRTHQVPSLAELIAQQAARRQLGASWTSG
jgi:hypothetical protein